MTQGVTAGFEDVLLEHLDMLYSLSRRLCDTSQDAEDLVQDTGLSAWRAWQQHGAPNNPKAWMATICLNHARSRWRRRDTRPAETLVADVELDHTLNAHPGPGVDVEAIANLEAHAVRAQVATLSYHQREAICLMDLCGFTAAQSAAVLGVSRNTVLSRTHRGHLALAALLIDWTRTE